MDHSFVSSFEVNLGWLSDAAYMRWLYTQTQKCQTHGWLYDLRSRLYFMLSQCQTNTRTGGILQLRSYLLDEISTITFGISCNACVIDEVTELLQADPELCRLECIHAARSRRTGLMGYEPVEAAALSLHDF